MIVVIPLFCDLLLEEIGVERTRFGRARGGYMNVLDSSHGPAM